MIRIFLLLCVAALSSGCFVVYSSPAPRAIQLHEPKTRVATEPVRHEATSLLFPKKAGSYLLVGTTQFDTEGLDIDAAYMASPTSAQITVYVYPGPGIEYFGTPKSTVRKMEAEEVGKAMDAAAIQIGAGKSGFKLIQDGAFDSPLGQGSARCWEFVDERVPGAETQVTCCRILIYDHKWFIKTRLTGPASEHAELEATIDEILANLKVSKK